MKIKLLTNGGYLAGCKSLTGKVVEAKKIDGLYTVKGSELNEEDFSYTFFEKEVEVLETDHIFSVVLDGAGVYKKKYFRDFEKAKAYYIENGGYIDGNITENNLTSIYTETLCHYVTFFKAALE